MNLIWRNDVRKSFAGMIAFASTLLAFTAAALSAELKNWAIWHQPAASDMMERIEWFDAYTFWFIGPITVFVMILLVTVMIRFRAKANPVPTTTTHNSLVEVVWTVVPVIILVMIAIPSFDLLNRQLDPKTEPDMTIKAVGYQWYWGYEYQDGSEITFDSVLIGREKYSNPAAAKQERDEYGKSDEDKYPYLMAVDNELVVPVSKTVRVLVTAADVLHAFTVPALGFKMDAVPGRMNETWFKADREGLFYGQCSELCGKDHAYMPVAIRVVSDEQFAAWKAAAASDVESANKALMAAVEGAGASLKVAAKR
jgi:cytochrome c oxidase subunit 2